MAAYDQDVKKFGPLELYSTKNFWAENYFKPKGYDGKEHRHQVLAEVTKQARYAVPLVRSLRFLL